MSRTNVVWILLGLGLLTVIAIYGTDSGNDAVAQTETAVDCNAGQSLAQALNMASEGETIFVTGSCNEVITITTDRITLDGQGNAVIAGGGEGPPNDVTEGVINIVGARGVTSKGITVQNGPGGIFGRGGANFSLEDTIVQNNANEGIQVVGNSSVRIANCTVQGNDGTGILITRNSSADFQENIIVHDNHMNGIRVELSSSAIFQGDIEATNNAIEGIAISVSSSGVFSESTITANQNGRYGIFVSSTSHLVIQSNTVIETKSNF